MISAIFVCDRLAGTMMVTRFSGETCTQAVRRLDRWIILYSMSVGVSSEVSSGSNHGKCFDLKILILYFPGHPDKAEANIDGAVFLDIPKTTTKIAALNMVARSGAAHPS